jgi:hypothetical protein
VHFIAHHGIVDARGSSLLGRNVSCMHRYNIPLSYIVDGPFTDLINSYVQGLYDILTAALANLLVKALKLKDGLRVLPYSQLLLNSNDVKRHY